MSGRDPRAGAAAPPAPVPADPRAGLLLAARFSGRGGTQCSGDPAYESDGTLVLVADAVRTRAPWMEHRDGRQMGGPDIEGILRRAVAEAGYEDPPVYFAAVYDCGETGAEAPFDPARPDPADLLARFVDAAGDPVVDVQAGRLRAVLAAVEPVDRTTYGGARHPLLFWREGLVVAALMPVLDDTSEAAARRLVAGIPTADRRGPPHDPVVLPEPPAPGDARPAAWLRPCLDAWAAAMGGVRRAGPASPHSYPWVVPTRGGPLRLGVRLGPPALVGCFAAPHAARRLSPGGRTDPLGEPTAWGVVEFEVDAGDGAARGLRQDGFVQRATATLGAWALPPALRPTADALIAQDEFAFVAPPGPVGRGVVLGPGARRVYVIRPAIDSHGLPMPGRWQVLDRRRWVRLAGHAAHFEATVIAERLNRVARGP